jgi:hypothetical protein
MRRARITGLVTLLGLVGPMGDLASAQTPTPAVLRPAPRYSLIGVITDVSRSPLVDALVGLNIAGELVATVRTTADGRFQFDDLLPVRAGLHVQRAGFHPRTVAVDLAVDSARGLVTVVLTPMSAAEAAKTAAAAPQHRDSLAGALMEGDDGSQRLRAFNQRRQHSRFAFFFDGDQIRQRNPQYASEMLKTVPGAILRGSDRVGNTIRLRGCRPMLWVDGLRVPGAELDEMAHPSDVAALEIYPSLGSIPPQFADQPSKCGSIVVWMR